MERAVLESGGDHITTQHLHFISIKKSRPTQIAPETKPDKSAINKEQLVYKRSSSSGKDDLDSDESRIMQFVRENGMINNTDCRTLLDVDRHRANYLLKKLNQYGLLQIEGSGRWAVYRLNE